MKLLKILAAGAVAIAGCAAISIPAQAGNDEYIGELMIGGWNFCPRGSAAASGQLLAISQNNALFSLLGTTYGGDGRTTFALPDLRGRAPLHAGNGPGLTSRRLGQRFGAEQTIMSVNNMPAHSHTGAVAASPALGNSDQPVRNSFAQAPAGSNIYQTGDPVENNMHANILRINNTGGGLATNNMQPSLVMQYCVVTQGTFPSRS